MSDYQNPSTTTPGGRLEVINGTLTGDNQWNGVAVAGIKTRTQALNSIFASAYFDFSTISNAYTALLNYDYDGDPGNNLSSGGIIQCTNNTHFYDNQTDVIMDSYTRKFGSGVVNDLSYFQSCYFIKTGAKAIQGLWMSGQNNLPTMMWLRNVEGVRILGCTFSNSYMGIRSYAQAIKADNAGFNLDQLCAYPSPIWGANCIGDQSRIMNVNLLSSTIEVNNTANFHRVYIRNTKIESCHNAISLSGCFYPVITGNDITVAGGFQNELTTGLYLSRCTGYRIEENTISGDAASVTTTTNAMGLAIVNSGTNYNEAYKNTFKNLNYSMQSVGNNRYVSPTYKTGLTFLCNNMEINNLNNSYDISVANQSGPALLTSGISYYQYASPSTAAGNVFASKSLPAGSFNNFFDNIGNPINYYYSGAPGSNSNPPYNNITTYVSGTNNCPSKLTSGPLITTTDYNNRIPILREQILTGGIEGTPSVYSEYRLLVDSMINTTLYGDSIGPDFATLESVLSNLDLNYDDRIQLAGLYVQENRYNEAISLLQHIPVAFTLGTEEQTRLTNLIDMYTIMELLDNSGDWNTLTEEQKSTVLRINGSDDGYANAVSRYLLSRYQGQSFLPSWVTFDDNGNPLARKANIEYANLVYPNPVKDILHIQIATANPSSVTVTDLLGKSLFSSKLTQGENSLNLAGLSSGMYLVKIYENGQLKETQKITK